MLSQAGASTSALRPGIEKYAITSAEVMCMLLKLEPLDEAEQKVIESICHRSPDIGQAAELARDFHKIVRQRQPEELKDWITKVQRSEIPELKAFVCGLERDRAAVDAALTYEWSNGPVEGQVHRLKLIKRKMYGRAKVDLLKAKVLHHA